VGVERWVGLFVIVEEMVGISRDWVVRLLRRRDPSSRSRYNPKVLFEWDPKKAAANFSKHDVSFQQAASVFLDPLAWTFPDPDHSEGETRFITIGESADSQLIVIAHLDLEEERIRIINARPATRREHDAYENA
jgi:uncharacterized DUF497 family protein